MITLPNQPLDTPITVQAPMANRWIHNGDEVWVLRGGVTLQQGTMTARCRAATLWFDRGRYGERRNAMTVYLEGQVVVTQPQDQGPLRLEDSSWYGKLESVREIELRTPPPAAEPDQKPPVYINGMTRRHAYSEGAIRRTQFASPIADPAQGGAAPGGAASGGRRIRAFPRSSAPVQATWFPSPDGNEFVAIVDSGINLIIDGVDEFGTVDVSTDRLVIWTRGAEPDLTGQTTQSPGTPLEIYMEGNVVFRQGERVVRAQRMYYDVTNEIGVIIQAEVLTPVPNYRGLLRMKADLMQQTSRDRFIARNAFITSSLMGVPGYKLSSSTIELEDNQIPQVSPFTGEIIIDPATGEPLLEHKRQARTFNNVVSVEGLPVFYWPVFAANLEKPEFYLRRISFGNDNIFGTQIRTDFDGYQVLGIDNPPDGTDLEFSLDYLSNRGIGHGAKFQYNRVGDLFGIDGAYAGFLDYWGISDHDLDNLGAGRSAVTYPDNYRYRLYGRHRWELPDDWRLTGELGVISDRNFVEEYFERQWDTFEDMRTSLELKRMRDNRSFSGTAGVRVNDFFTQTEWLPRFDHFWLGQPLAQDTLTRYGHSSAGYARFLPAGTPYDPGEAAIFKLLPWETSQAQGERFVTNQELDLPMVAGPAKVTPYVFGQAAHWGEDLMGNDFNRIYGRAGVRASLPMFSIDPTAENELFNVHGLAHKVVFSADASVADASQGLTALPMYDNLDDDAQEQFRRRFQVNTFGGTIPARFDPRYYAVRSGLGESVTSPSAEMIDDLAVVRLGARQRWQTKRGLPGQRKIIDWIVLDTTVSYFPDATRDNFGEDFGLLGYDFRWHVGDRTTVTSDGTFDFFDQGQRLARVGINFARPPRGDLYVSFRNLEGPINSQVLFVGYNYRMSEKWISSYGTGYDFGVRSNIGQSFSITRIGESFLVNLGFVVDPYRNNFSFMLNFEPRFMPRHRLGNVAGAQIPIAGANGLE